MECTVGIDQGMKSCFESVLFLCAGGFAVPPVLLQPKGTSSERALARSWRGIHVYVCLIALRQVSVLGEFSRPDVRVAVGLRLAYLNHIYVWSALHCVP